MYEEDQAVSFKTKFAVIFSAFLLISPGFTPAMASSGATISRELAGNLFILFVLIDPFASASFTIHAPAVGAAPVQSAVSSSDVESTTTMGAVAVYSSSSSTFVSLVAIVPGIWDESSKKRSRPQIYVEILELLKRGPMTPFEIAFYVRLNHKRCKEYVRLLERNGYLRSNEEDGRKVYSLSENGKKIVDRVRALFEKNETSTAMRERLNSG